MRIARALPFLAALAACAPATGLAPGAARADGLPRKATLGVLVAPVPDSLRARDGLAAGEGALVRGAAPGYAPGRTPLRARSWPRCRSGCATRARRATRSPTAT